MMLNKIKKLLYLILVCSIGLAEAALSNLSEKCKLLKSNNGVF